VYNDHVSDFDKAEKLGISLEAFESLRRRIERVPFVPCITHWERELSAEEIAAEAAKHVRFENERAAEIEAMADGQGYSGHHDEESN
jgi:hypothetical protein